VEAQILSSPNQTTRTTPQFSGLGFLIATAIITYGIVAISILRKGWSIETWIAVGRSSALLEVADRLLKWNFSGLEVKAFWGVSIATALVSRLTGLSVADALLGICVFCGLASIYLVYLLFGWQIASLATFLSGSWVKHVLLGGTEPLFVFLILLAIWFLRANRLIACAVLAGIACTVRPVGAMLPIALVGCLLYRRKVTESVKCAAVIGAIGLSYAALLYAATGSPFSNVHGYRGDWSGNLPIGIPVLAIFRTAPFTSMSATLKDLAFVGLTFLCLYHVGIRLAKGAVATPLLAESWFVILFAAFHLSYNSPYGLSEFPRFIVPLVPWLAAAIYAFVPLGRVQLMAAAVIMTSYNAYTLG
jgi:hypothetical protein